MLLHEFNGNLIRVISQSVTGATHVAFEYFDLRPALQIFLILLGRYYTKTGDRRHHSEGKGEGKRMQTNEGLHWHRGLDLELEEVRASLHRELGA